MISYLSSLLRISGENTPRMDSRPKVPDTSFSIAAGILLVNVQLDLMSSPSRIPTQAPLNTMHWMQQNRHALIKCDVKEFGLLAKNVGWRVKWLVSHFRRSIESSVWRMAGNNLMNVLLVQVTSPFYLQILLKHVTENLLLNCLTMFNC